MSISINQVMEVLESISLEVQRLPARIKIAANQVTVTSGLADISKRLGLVTAGEFRSGNDKEPGFGFSGVRIGYPPFSYNSEDWNVAGVSNDVLQFGINADDGKAYLAGGNIILNSDGIQFLNNAGQLQFESFGGQLDGIIIYAKTSDMLLFQNNIATKGFQFAITLTNSDNPYLIIAEDSVVTNAMYMALNEDPTAPTTFVIGGSVYIWANLDGRETTFNDTSYDIDFRIKGATDDNLFVIDAGLDAIGIGGAAESGYKLKVTGNQRITGNLKLAGIENDTGLASGTYTPTLTNGANVDASTAYQCLYTRIGNVVTVAGKIDIDATLTATVTQVDLTLPIASSLANDYELSGSATNVTDPTSGTILAEVTADKARIVVKPTGIGNQGYRFVFMYQIL